MNAIAERQRADDAGRFPTPLLVTAYRMKWETPLRVPDILLNSVGFVADVLGPDLSQGSLEPMATSFIVSIPSSEIRNGRIFYAVTAKHVFKETQNVERVIIVNKKGGGVKPLLIIEGWHSHPDPAVDVAVIQIYFDPEIELLAFDVEDFFDEASNTENIGVGDEVFFPGLFSPVPGIEKVIPLVRHGNLAMLPGQQIQTDDGYADLYLIEARSIGGISGSPVFVRETMLLPVDRDNGTKAMMQGIGAFKLLGMIQAHWDVDESQINQAHTSHAPKRGGVNMGIAKVIPAKKILEAINGPGPKAIREAFEAAYKRQQRGSSSMD